MGASDAADLCRTSHKDASTSRSVGKLPPDEVAALVEEVRRLADVGEVVPPLVRAAAAGDVVAVQRYLQEGDIPGMRDAAGRTPLHWAAGAGSGRLVNALLAMGADVGARDLQGGTPLHHAAVGHSASAATLLLAAGASHMDRDSQGRTPLMCAAVAGYAPLCELLAGGSSERVLNTTDNLSQTALHLAARAGQASAVCVLVARGASVNVVDAKERVPLHCALLFYRQTQEVALLARHYPQKGDGDCEDEGDDSSEATRQAVVGLLAGGNASESACHRDKVGMTPLMWALRLRLPAVARVLIHGSCSDYRSDISGRTALHWAARAGDTYIVCYLLQCGYSPWKPDMQGCDSVMEAVESRNMETVRELLSDGKYVSRRNAAGQTALHIAVGFCDAKMTQCLLELGAKAGCVDGEGRTALFRALEAGEAGREVAQHLLVAGAYRMQHGRTDERGRTLLHVAAGSGDVAMVRALLRRGASHKAVDEDGESPLGCALRHRRLEVVRVFLQRRKLQLTADGRGRTPLHWAAAAGWLQEARLLCEAGCDPQQRDQYGRSAIVTAAENDHWDLADKMFEW